MMVDGLPDYSIGFLGWNSMAYCPKCTPGQMVDANGQINDWYPTTQRFVYENGALVFTGADYTLLPTGESAGNLSGLFSAANNGQQPLLTPHQQKALHCLGQAASAKGFSIALDVAGSIPGFGNLFSGTVEGVQALNAGYYGLVSLSNAGNTLLNPSASGAANTAATAGFAVASLALKGSKAIPVVGTLVSLGFLAYDAAGAVSTYQQCMAGPG
jgi:hypothetical protein